MKKYCNSCQPSCTAQETRTFFTYLTPRSRLVYFLKTHSKQFINEKFECLSQKEANFLVLLVDHGPNSDSLFLFNPARNKPKIAFSSHLGTPFFKLSAFRPNHGGLEERLNSSRILRHIRAQKELDDTKLFCWFLFA